MKSTAPLPQMLYLDVYGATHLHSMESQARMLGAETLNHRGQKRRPERFVAPDSRFAECRVCQELKIVHGLTQLAEGR